MKSVIQSFTEVKARAALAIVAVLFLYLVGAFQATTAANGPQQPNEVIVTQCGDFGGALLVMTPKDIDAAQLNGGSFHVYNDGNPADIYIADSANFVNIDDFDVPYMVMLTSFSGGTFAPDANNDIIHITNLSYTDSTVEDNIYPIFYEESCAGDGNGGGGGGNTPAAFICTDFGNQAGVQFPGQNSIDASAGDEFAYVLNAMDSPSSAMPQLNEHNDPYELVFLTFDGYQPQDGDSLEIYGINGFDDQVLTFQAMQCSDGGGGGGNNRNVTGASAYICSDEDPAQDFYISFGEEIEQATYSFSIYYQGMQIPVMMEDWYENNGISNEYVIVHYSGVDVYSDNVDDFSVYATATGLSSGETIIDEFLPLQSIDCNSGGGGDVDPTQLSGVQDPQSIIDGQTVSSSHTDSNNITYHQVIVDTDASAYSFELSSEGPTALNTNDINLFLSPDVAGPDWGNLLDSTNGTCLGLNTFVPAGTYYIGVASSYTSGDYDLTFYQNVNTCDQGGGGEDQGLNIDPSTYNINSQEALGSWNQTYGSHWDNGDIEVYQINSNWDIWEYSIILTNDDHGSIADDYAMFFAPETGYYEPDWDNVIVQGNTACIGQPYDSETNNPRLPSGLYNVGIATESSTGDFRIEYREEYVCDDLLEAADLELDLANDLQINVPQSSLHLSTDNVIAHRLTLNSDVDEYSFSIDNSAEGSIGDYFKLFLAPDDGFGNPDWQAAISTTTDSCLGSFDTPLTSGDYFLGLATTDSTGGYEVTFNDRYTCNESIELNDWIWPNSQGTIWSQYTEQYVNHNDNGAFTYYQINLNYLQEYSVRINTNSNDGYTLGEDYKAFFVGENEWGGPDFDNIIASSTNSCFGQSDISDLPDGTYYVGLATVESTGSFGLEFRQMNDCHEALEANNFETFVNDSLTLNEQYVASHNDPSEITTHAIYIPEDIDSFSINVNNNGPGAISDAYKVFLAPELEPGQPDWDGYLYSTTESCLGSLSSLPSGNYYVGIATTGDTGHFGLTFNDSFNCHESLEANNFGLSNQGSLYSYNQQSFSHWDTNNMTYYRLSNLSGLNEYSIRFNNDTNSGYSIGDDYKVFFMPDNGFSNPDVDNVIASSTRSCFGASDLDLPNGDYYIGVVTSQSTGSAAIEFRQENDCHTTLDPEDFIGMNYGSINVGSVFPAAHNNAEEISEYLVYVDNELSEYSIVIDDSQPGSIENYGVFLAPDDGFGSPDWQYRINEGSENCIGSVTTPLTPGTYFIGIASTGSTGPFNLTLQETFTCDENIDPEMYSNNNRGELYFDSEQYLSHFRDYEIETFAAEFYEGQTEFSFQLRNDQQNSIGNDYKMFLAPDDGYGYPDWQNVITSTTSSCLGSSTTIPEAGTYHIGIATSETTGEFYMTYSDTNHCGENDRPPLPEGNEAIDPSTLDETLKGDIILDETAYANYADATDLNTHKLNLNANVDYLHISIEGAQPSPMDVSGASLYLFPQFAADLAETNNAIASGDEVTELIIDQTVSAGTYYIGVASNGASGDYQIEVLSYEERDLSALNTSTQAPLIVGTPPMYGDLRSTDNINMHPVNINGSYDDLVINVEAFGLDMSASNIHFLDVTGVDPVYDPTLSTVSGGLCLDLGGTMGTVAGGSYYIAIESSTRTGDYNVEIVSDPNGCGEGGGEQDLDPSEYAAMVNGYLTINESEGFNYTSTSNINLHKLEVFDTGSELQVNVTQGPGGNPIDTSGVTLSLYSQFAADIPDWENEIISIDQEQMIIPRNTLLAGNTYYIAVLASSTGEYDIEVSNGGGGGDEDDSLGLTAFVCIDDDRSGVVFESIEDATVFSNSRYIINESINPIGVNQPDGNSSYVTFDFDDFAPNAGDRLFLNGITGVDDQLLIFNPLDCGAQEEQGNNGQATVDWMQCHADICIVGFSDPMDPLEVVNFSNYTLESSSQGTLDLSAVSSGMYFNQAWNELEIYLAPGTFVDQETVTLTVDRSLATADASTTMSTQTCDSYENRACNVGISYVDAIGFDVTAQDDYLAFNDTFTQVFNPVDCWPDSMMENQTTTYRCSIPISKQLTTDSKIIMEFSDSTIDLSNARVDSNNPITGGQTFISETTVDNSDKRLTLTVQGTTEVNDYLHIEIQGIVNGDADEEEIDWNNYWANTDDGNYVTISTKNAANNWLEKGRETARYFYTPGGDNDLTITIQNSEGRAIGEDDARVWLYGFQSGQFTQNTDSNGQVVFTGLPSGDYEYWVEPLVDGIGHKEPKFEYINSDVNRIITVKTAGKTISGTISHSRIGTDRDVSVEVYAASPQGWFSKNITLDRDGSTNYSLAVTEGKFFVGVMPSYFDFSTGIAEDVFFPPQEKEVNLKSNASTKSGVNFTLKGADAEIVVTVNDKSGNGLNNVNVNAYNPANPDQGFAYGTTKPNGEVTLNVSEGEWIVSAHKFGLPTSREYIVEVEDGDSESLTVVMSKSDSSVTITGSVTSENAAMEGVIVNCWGDRGSYGEAFTSESGTYTIFAENRSNEKWDCEAWSPNYGSLPAASGVNNRRFNLNGGVSGMNFEYDSANFATISGTAPAYTSIWAEAISGDEFYGPFLGSGFADENGDYEMTIQQSNDNVVLKAWSPDTGELAPLELGAVTSDRADADFQSLSVHTIDVRFTADNVEDITIGDGNSIPEVFVDFFDSRTGYGNGAPMTDTDGDDIVGTVKVATGSYDIGAYIEGIGFIQLETLGISSDRSLTYNLTEYISTTDYSGTVTDGEGNPIKNAWVDAYNPETGGSSFTQTDARGEFTLYLKDGTWNISAFKDSYSAGKPVTFTSTERNKTIVLKSAGSTISGSIELAGGVVPQNAHVWAESSTGEFSSSEALDGEYTLPVSEDSGTWTVYASNGQYEDSTTASVGDSNADITLETQVPWFNDTFEPKASAVKGSTGGVVSADGVEANIPANALNNSADSSSVTVTNASAPKGKTKSPLGNRFDIDATDADGNPITDLQSNIQLTFEYDKEKIDTLIANGNMRESDLETMSIAYWNSSAGEWLSESTTRSIQVQRNEGDEFASVEYATALAGLDNYNDYRVKLKASVDHLTIFGAITGTDETAPDAPENLTVTAGEENIVLDWDDNDEEDLLEYLVFRGTEADFTANNDSQINEAQVTTSTFTDTTAEAGTTYYYKVKAADTSGNESAVSNEASDAIAAPEEEGGEEGGEEEGGEEEGGEEEEVGSSGGNGGGGSASKVVERVTTTETTEDDSEEVDEDEETPENNFKDIADHWAKDYIIDLHDQGIVNGVSETAFDPDKTITRAEFAKIIVYSFGYDLNTEFKGTFDDVTANDWYALVVETAADEGIVNSGGTFRPEDPITRAAALRMLLDAAKAKISDAPDNPFTDVPQSEWFADYVDFAYAANIVSGKSATKFAPADNVTRAETSKIVSEMIKQGFTD